MGCLSYILGIKKNWFNVVPLKGLHFGDDHDGSFYGGPFSMHTDIWYVFGRDTVSIEHVASFLTLPCTFRGQKYFLFSIKYCVYVMTFHTN